MHRVVAEKMLPRDERALYIIAGGDKAIVARLLNSARDHNEGVASSKVSPLAQIGNANHGPPDGRPRIVRNLAILPP